jgi:IS4 transposase
LIYGATSRHLSAFLPEKVHDVRVLDKLPIERGAFYVMDKGYVDFARLFRMHQQGAFFVIRPKKNQPFIQQEIRKVDATTGIRSDETIRFSARPTKSKFPGLLRRVAFYDVAHDNNLVFVTNNFELPPLSIALLYRKRWHVELFFKWIKQHLKITAFYGNSDNAVRTQIWIAVSVYVLVAILRKRLACHLSMADILQVLSVNAFEKIPINTLFSQASHKLENTTDRNQLRLFDF